MEMCEERRMQMRLVCAMAGLMLTGVALGQAPATAAQPTGPAGEVQGNFAAIES